MHVMWVGVVSAPLVENCSSLDRLQVLNIDLQQAIMQIDVTWFQIRINLDHTDILRWTLKE